MVRNGAPTLAYLEWRDNSSGENGFELYRRQGAGEWQFHALLPANETTFLDFALVPGTVYHYRVRAIGGNGPSTWSRTRRAGPRLLSPGGVASIGRSTTYQAHGL
jgi:hypothetical protein